MILSKSKIKKLDIDSFINNFIMQKKLDELLIIVPTNRKIRYLKRELISNSPKKSASKLNLYTLETFTKSIFNQDSFSGLKTPSEAAAAVLLNKAFKETNLKYFSNYKDEIPKGTLERVKNVISQYKLNGITSKQLIIEADKLDGSEKLKAIDIANVYNKYLADCSELKLYELGDIYAETIKLNNLEFKERFKENFSDASTIIINGFDEFTQLEIEIIDKLTSLNFLEVYLLFDYHKYNKNLFAHLDTCYDKFIDKGFREIEDTTIIKFKNYQNKIREELFLPDQNKNIDFCELELTELIAQNPEDEITLIAKEIKRLITHNNINSANIAVGFNLISNHSEIIRDIFYKYGIPFNLTDRYALSDSQPIVALINLLEIIENNFYYKNIFRALTGKWIKIKKIDLSNLLRVSSNLKIVSGYRNWIETLDQKIEEIKNGAHDDGSKLLPLRYYENARKDIENIFEILKPFRSKKTIIDFRKSLFDLISSVQLSNTSINDHPEVIEKNVKALTVFIETIDELFELLILEYGAQKEFGLNFYLAQIKTAIQFTRYNIKERHSSGVLVTSVNELRGLNFDFVFIGGLVDGEFPTRYQPEIFFSGSYKKDEYKHILEERYHFYQTLCCANKKLYLSYPLKDEKKEFTPSSFLTDFKKLFKIKSKFSQEFEKLLFSKSEFLQNINKLKAADIKTTNIDFQFDLVENQKDIEIDKARFENPLQESVYSGYIYNQLDEFQKEKLLAHKSQQFSASQLEEYAKCPFQYFAKRILQLEILEEPTDEIEALELGSLIHSILYEFYSTIKTKNIIIAGCDDIIFNEIFTLIFSIAENKIEKLRLNSEIIFYEKEKILGINGDKRKSILFKFLEEERNNADGYLPEYFEMEFGDFKNSANENNSNVLIGDVKVRGKIDRIDLNKENNQFKVIDYKLGGNKPSEKDLRSGVSLQLPLYVYASKILIENQLKNLSKPASAIIYSLKPNKNEFGKKNVHLLSTKKKISDDELMRSTEELLKICEEFIPLYTDKISKGIFHLSQLEDRDSKVCRFCDFMSICRIQELS